MRGAHMKRTPGEGAGHQTLGPWRSKSMREEPGGIRGRRAGGGRREPRLPRREGARPGGARRRRRGCRPRELPCGQRAGGQGRQCQAGEGPKLPLREAGAWGGSQSRKGGLCPPLSKEKRGWRAP